MQVLCGLQGIFLLFNCQTPGVIPICGVIILIYNVLNMIDIVRAKGVMPDPTDE